jgi:hypothetical protein
MTQTKFINSISRFALALAVPLLFTIGAGTAFAQTKIATKPVEPFYKEVAVATPAVYEPKVTYLSPEKIAPITFTSLGATWEQSLPTGTSVEIEVRLKSRGKYSDWYPLEPSIDEKGQQANKSLMSAFLTTNSADGYQYRITLHSQVDSVTPVLENLKFTFINGGTPAEKTNLLLVSRETSSLEDNEYLPEDFDPSNYKLPLVKSTSLSAQAESPVVFPTTVKSTVKTPIRAKTSISKLKIISRAEWGADESIRIFRSEEENKEPDLVTFEDNYYTKFANELKESRHIETDEAGNQLTWPLSYPESIKKIVIHHTATVKNLDNPKQAIRDIYVWHTISKGWGDIGYNYIIDQQGNIYEGRYGGEMVVGAHAGRGNHGSIGIAVLGNYQDQDPPEAVVTALTTLIKEKAEKYNIDTEGSGLFRGEDYPNVMGHRDIMSTSCPGDRLYAMLPVIRKLAKAKTTTASSIRAVSDYDFSWSASAAPLITLNPKSKKTVTFKIKNSGKKAWNKETYFQIKPTPNAQTFLRNSQEILTSAVGKEVKPGESVEIRVLLNSTAISGTGLIELQPIINKNTINKSLSFGLQIVSPAPRLKYDYELLSVIYNKNEFKKGDLVDVKVRLRNKGALPWPKTGNNRVTLGADKPRDHLNKLLVKPSNRLSDLTESLVKPGESATFTFQIKVPEQDGIYKEYFTPVVEGIQWMENRNTFIQVKVGNSDQLITPDLDDEGAPEAVKGPSPTPLGGSTVNVAAVKLNTADVPRPIRVDLAYRGSPAVISANGNFSLYQGSTKLADFTADQKVSVEFKDNSFQVTGNSKTYQVSSRPRFVPASYNVIMRIDNWERRNTWGDLANNNLFRGVLETIIYDGELHVVNELPLEDYLKGLAEESSTAPDEKIKTIMVIARTYARFYMDVATKFPGAPFDLNDDPNYSQKYMGYAFEARSPKTARLAAETAGQYVTYQGKLIKTPYFSKSDGKRTISAQDKWGWTDTPFLASVDDSMCKSTAFAGHGVGLSGCGATALANQGKTYQEIIKYYYQGTSITQTQY